MARYSDKNIRAVAGSSANLLKRCADTPKALAPPRLLFRVRTLPPRSCLKFTSRRTRDCASHARGRPSIQFLFINISQTSLVDFLRLLCFVLRLTYRRSACSASHQPSQQSRRASPVNLP